MYRYNKTEKVAGPPLASKRLLDQVRERIRYLHYSLKTEKAYLYWVRFFVLWSARQGGMRHPKDMGVAEVEAFCRCWPIARLPTGDAFAQTGVQRTHAGHSQIINQRLTGKIGHKPRQMGIQSYQIYSNAWNFVPSKRISAQAPAA